MAPTEDLDFWEYLGSRQTGYRAVNQAKPGVTRERIRGGLGPGRRRGEGQLLSSERLDTGVHWTECAIGHGEDGGL